MQNILKESSIRNYFLKKPKESGGSVAKQLCPLGGKFTSSFKSKLNEFDRISSVSCEQQSRVLNCMNNSTVLCD